MSTVELKAERAAELKAAHAVVDAAKAAGRDLTAAEIAGLESRTASIKALDERLARAATGEAAMKMLGQIAGPDSNHVGLSCGSSFFNFTGAGAKAAANATATKMMEASFGSKALLPAGSVATSVQVVPASPLALGRVAQSVLDVLPVVQHEGSRYAYLRQASRVNNAAVVPVGTLKPTSVYGIQRIEQDLAVIAHVSEGIDTYWLNDAPSLQQFINSELLYGLRVAIEAQVLNGNGTAPNMLGLLQVSGIQAQAAVGTDLFKTTRAAITALETVGEIPGAFVVNPVDWQRFELATASGSGEFILENSPVDRAEQKLWGVPVVLSTTIAAGTAVLIDLDDVALQTDTFGIVTKWSENVGTDFSFNMLRARSEGRFGIAVYQPLGVCKIALP